MSFELVTVLCREMIQKKTFKKGDIGLKLYIDKAREQGGVIVPISATNAYIYYRR